MRKTRIQVQGGLGNQLFIWAMAHEILHSAPEKVELIFVADKYQRFDRPNELTEIVKYCNHSISIKSSRIWGYIFKLIDKSHKFSASAKLILESFFKVYSCPKEYEIPVMKIFNRRMLRGNFQNFEMVNRQKSEIYGEILTTLRNTYTRHIQDQTIHIRRGDTINIASSWGVLSQSYYEKLIVESKSSIICTDSEEIVRTFSTKYPDAQMSTPNTETAWQTLKILSQGNRFIGSNSTLSWWAAWIITNKKSGIAILPTPWRPGNNEISKYLQIEKAHYEQAEFVMADG